MIFDLLAVERSRRWKLTFFVKRVTFKDAVGQKVIDLRADGRTDVRYFIGTGFCNLGAARHLHL